MSHVLYHCTAKKCNKLVRVPYGWRTCKKCGTVGYMTGASLKLSKFQAGIRERRKRESRRVAVNAMVEWVQINPMHWGIHSSLIREIADEAIKIYQEEK